jgi:hypothetical protein
MGKWTEWKLIADKYRYYTEDFDYNEPSCYELGIRKLKGGKVHPVYVGETVNERLRIHQYAISGSHLTKIINWHLRNGWLLFYRGQAKKSKREAIKMQNRLLDKYDYDWNIQLNLD